MKTVKEWFELIKDEKIRKEALENMDAEWSERKCSSVDEAIILGFKYSDTPQGNEYWFNIFKSEIELLGEPEKEDLIKRIEALEKIVLMGEDIKWHNLSQQQERKLIMSVDELINTDRFDDWRDENGIIMDTFEALKCIESQWNEGKEFDWECEDNKNCLFLWENEWTLERFGASAQIFNFHEKEHSQLFLTTFAKELEIIKPLFS